MFLTSCPCRAILEGREFPSVVVMISGIVSMDVEGLAPYLMRVQEDVADN